MGNNIDSDHSEKYVNDDLSFNNLTGDVHGGRAPAYTYLTGNRLSGEVESGVFLKSNAQIDLSYNNFSWWPSCQENRTGILPCAGPINCTSCKYIISCLNISNMQLFSYYLIISF
ncbi:hypothetical protein YC2023_083192 [Brassica napus]